MSDTGFFAALGAFLVGVAAFIPRAVVQGVPLLLGSTGETLTEKSGNLNLGIPGVMYVGGISGVVGAFYYDQSVRAGAMVDGVLDTARYAANMNGFLAITVPVLSCLLGALLMGLLYCFLTVTLRANQNVTGLALTTFGVGIGNFFGGSLIKLSGSDVPSIALTRISTYFHASLPFADSLGWFGQVFLSYGFLAYTAVIIALAAAYVLKRTRVGLHLRAVGENPATADAAGISVNRYKYASTCIGSMIAGLGGLYYVMDYASGVWSNNAFGDRGWLAIALVIFTIWRPNVGVLASFLFGGLYILHMYIPTGMNLAVKELYKMAPYVVTLIVLILSSLRNKRENQPPQHLGLPYFREER
ncbi:MAG: ABC transporter permease [Clostridia bacterium]|nr:ABC transporter permease [Clostridia bacterium]